MNRCYRVNLRLNLEDPREKAAAEYLEQIARDGKQSRNRFLVDLLLAKLENSRDFTLEDVQRVVRQELQSVSLAPRPTEQAPELTAREQEENARNVLEDLEMFG